MSTRQPKSTRQSKAVGLVQLAKSVSQKEAGAYSPSTINNLLTAVRSLLNYAGANDLPLIALDETLVVGYQRWLLGRGICLNTVSCYMRSLRSLHNKAAEMGCKVQPEPFTKAYTGRMKTEKRSISSSEILAVAAIELPERSFMTVVRDVFVFSFMAMGMPFVDVCFLSKAQIRGRQLRYNRTKTGQPVCVQIEDSMQRIIDKYTDCHAHYVFPLINATDYPTAYREYLHMLCRYNQVLKLLARKAGVKSNLTSYSTRHTWASLAYLNGIDLPVISKALGHSNTSVTMTYIREINDNRLQQANARLLSQLGLE